MRLDLILRLLLAAGFLVGTTTHAIWITRYGVFQHHGFPLWKNIFWDSLLLLDPMAAALLIWRPRAGLVLGLAIMAADLAINWTSFEFATGGFALTLQTLFGLALVASTPVIRDARKRHST
jgi:hypothetical protein